MHPTLEKEECEIHYEKKGVSMFEHKGKGLLMPIK
jgi:hypothetical protein